MNKDVDIRDVTPQSATDHYRRNIVEPAETHPRHLRMTREQTVKVRLDRLGMATIGGDGTVIGDLAIGDVCTGVEVFTDVGKPTRIRISLLAVPVELEVMGVVEIDDAGIDIGLLPG